MLLFHRCFSNILLVKTNYLVSTSVEHWSKMGSYFSAVFVKKNYKHSACSDSHDRKDQKILDKIRSFGALLTDLPKAFDFMTYDLLISKLRASNVHLT